MFKLPSLRLLIINASTSLKRFPQSLLCSVCATSIAIYFIHNSYDRDNLEYLWKCVICCYLGLPLFLSLQLFSETKNFKQVQSILTQLFALILLVIYYFSLPPFKDFLSSDYIRFALYSIALHLLVAFAPFLNNGNANGFWQYNKTLFIRILTSALYTGVLYAGLALALLAIDKLFKIHINDKYYLDLWWVLAGVFNTWFFLAGIPKSIQHLNECAEYPKGLKVFTQFVLLPLVAIYLFILYAYGVKIALAMELPKGWVSYLIVGYAVAGILSLLLIWPLQETQDNKWIKTISRFFYIALFPLISLLGLAIYKRVSQYGITENRYFLLVIALWLTSMAIYFLFSKSKNIKAIPLSLCLVALFSSFGPWGAFSISEYSQLNRLEKLLLEEKILVDGKIKKSPILLRNSNSEQIVTLLDYFENSHGYKSLQPWIEENIDSLFAPKDSVNQYVYKKKIILDIMGVDDYYSYSHDGMKDFYMYAENNYQAAINITGFDYYTTFNIYTYGNDTTANIHPIILNINDTINLRFRSNHIELLKGTLVTRRCYLGNFVRNLKNNYYRETQHQGLPKEHFVFPFESDSLLLQFNFNSIQGSLDEKDSLSINSMDANLLIKKK